MRCGAIVLTGGGSRRLGGVHKPALTVGHTSMLDNVLAATAELPTVIVGSDIGVPPGLLVVQESPPGGGPVAAVAAGLAHLPEGLDACVVLAADLPFVTSAQVDRLQEAVRGHDLAVFLDAAGHQQWLCAGWNLEALNRRLTEIGSAHGTSLRRLADGVRRIDLLDETGSTQDVDTPEDLRSARLRWADDLPE